MTDSLQMLHNQHCHMITMVIIIITSTDCHICEPVEAQKRQINYQHTYIMCTTPQAVNTDTNLVFECLGKWYFTDSLVSSSKLS